MTRLINLVGQRFGSLVVLSKHPTNLRKNCPSWDCICDCGTKTVKVGQDLRAGCVKSCGCSSYANTKKKDITGQKFGKLTAVRCTGKKNNQNNYIWEFLCDCGNSHVAAAGNIVHKGGSCGCALKEAPKNRDSYHGMKNTTEYKSWCKAKERCYNPNDPNYPNYGGAGIVMEETFKNDFKEFISYIGMKPSDGKRYTLDRLDNSKGYVKGNIRWATDTQQARNKTMMCNNTSGVTGVHWDNKKHPNCDKYSLYAVAQWHSLDGSFKKKSFSVKKYGLLEAFAMACLYREKMIEELNKQGAGYAVSHGK